MHGNFGKSAIFLGAMFRRIWQLSDLIQEKFQSRARNCAFIVKTADQWSNDLHTTNNKIQIRRKMNKVARADTFNFVTSNGMNFGEKSPWIRIRYGMIHIQIKSIHGNIVSMKDPWIPYPNPNPNSNISNTSFGLLMQKMNKYIQKQKPFAWIIFCWSFYCLLNESIWIRLISTIIINILSSNISHQFIASSLMELCIFNQFFFFWDVLIDLFHLWVHKNNNFKFCCFFFILPRLI